MLKSGSPFIYRQYLPDKAYEYVSLAAVDRCRAYSGFRIATKNGVEGMAQVRGSASYVFTVGSRTVIKSDEKREDLKQKAVSQQDSYISRENGKDYGTRYTYIEERDAKRFLNNECVYIPGTDWAVLVTPNVSRLLKDFLEALDEAGMVK